jgi:cobalt-precorrin-5B (C1)-methyltransferase
VVIKDAGDDPDVTNGAAIVATVRLADAGGLRILGGEGVGVVTRPGLPVGVGEPAINPVPRDMIAQAVAQAWAAGGRSGPPSLEVTISVPEGERLARRTLNPRLGILGGISILGTSGLVRPLSHEAYTATIESALKVASAAGQDEVVLVTGGRSEKRARALRPDLPELAFVQMADFFAFALGQVAEKGFPRLGLVSFFGKAVKQGQGLPCTHAHRAAMDLGVLGRWLGQAGASEALADQVARANTASHALEILRQAGRLDLVETVGARMLLAARDLAGPRVAVWAAVLDVGGDVLYDSRQTGRGA